MSVHTYYGVITLIRIYLLPKIQIKKYGYIYLLKYKSEAIKRFKEFKLDYIYFVTFIRIYLDFSILKGISVFLITSVTNISRLVFLSRFPCPLLFKLLVLELICI
jgi:hypothetical protein